MMQNLQALCQARSAMAHFTPGPMKSEVFASLNPVEIAANVSVGRACGFAGLAVLCVVLSFSFDPVLATKAGAIMSLAIAVILLWCSWRAPNRPYKKTEVWLILQKDDRPDEAYAQRLIGQALHECYVKFARTAAVVTALFATSAFALELLMAGT